MNEPRRDSRSAAREGEGRRTREANRAHVADVDDAAVAEARRAEVDVLLPRLHEVLVRLGAGEEADLRDVGARRQPEVRGGGGRGGEGTHEEVLQECRAPLELVVGAAREVARLLEEDGVGPEHLAHIDLDVLRACGRKLGESRAEREGGQGRERAGARGDARSSGR